MPGRGLFVSVIQDPPVLNDRAAIEELIRFSVRSRVKVLFVQVYRANKSWFPSRVADPEPYRVSFQKTGTDALALLIRKAHAEGIEVHAWFNVLSLSTNEDAPVLKKYGSGILTRNTAPKNSIRDYRIDNQYFLEPGDPRVGHFLSEVVAEALRAHPDLDGVQLDYIRYPDTHPAYGHTAVNLARFRKATGLPEAHEEDPVWKQWKYDQVTSLVKRLRGVALKIHPGIRFSTTGLMPYSRASLEAFQDWKQWLDTGLADFVTLMCYTDDMTAFKKYLANAGKTIELKRVNIAIAAEKLHRHPEVFREQLEACEEASPRACVMLHYGDLSENPALAEPLLSGK